MMQISLWKEICCRTILGFLSLRCLLSGLALLLFCSTACSFLARGLGHPTQHSQKGCRRKSDLVSLNITRKLIGFLALVVGLCQITLLAKTNVLIPKYSIFMYASTLKTRKAKNVWTMGYCPELLSLLQAMGITTVWLFSFAKMIC